MAQIGFIGLGIMGRLMANSLLKAGHTQVVYDIAPAGTDDVVAAGATKGSSPKDVAARRDFTDDSGGRTEIIRSGRDLAPATSSIANELSQQYYLGYPTGGKKDGRWHAIKVELRNCAYWVRARRGYIASAD